MSGKILLNHLIVCIRYDTVKYWSGMIYFTFDQRGLLRPSQSRWSHSLTRVCGMC